MARIGTLERERGCRIPRARDGCLWVSSQTNERDGGRDLLSFFGQSSLYIGEFLVPQPRCLFSYFPDLIGIGMYSRSS